MSRSLPRAILGFVWLMGFVYCQSLYANVAQISQARVSHTVEHHTINTRLILTINQPIQYHYFTLKSPNKVAFTCAGCAKSKTNLMPCCFF